MAGNPQHPGRLLTGQGVWDCVGAESSRRARSQWSPEHYGTKTLIWGDLCLKGQIKQWFVSLFSTWSIHFMKVRGSAMQRVTCQGAGEQQAMLLKESSGELTGLQRQLRQHRAAWQQAGQGLGHSVAQRIHAEVELLQTLDRRGGRDFMWPTLDYVWKLVPSWAFYRKRRLALSL